MGHRMGYHKALMDRITIGSWLDWLTARPFLCSALLFLSALALRLLALNRYVTPDELIWVYRSILFREAILARAWDATLVAGHPGVTTNWLGTLGISLQLLLRQQDQSVYTWITQMASLTPDNTVALKQLAQFVESGRTAVAVVNSLGIVAVFWLARALFNGGRIALLAAVLLAVDPFLSGLSGLFHVDGLMATFSILSLLALALGSGLGATPFPQRRRLLWLACSGAAAGLAVLSKSPALLLLPVAALALLSQLWREKESSLNGRLLAVISGGFIWLAAFLLVVWLLYPALWVTPRQVVSTLGGNAGRHIEEALRPTFFMGDVAYDNGPLFYPVALMWRLAPLVAGGLALLLIDSLRRRNRAGSATSVWLYLLWAALFLAGISLAAKKFDRYLLPVIPALAVLAAVGLAGAAGRFSKGRAAFLALLVALQLFMIATSFPYLLSAYNPLVGGPLTARYLLPIGWGEGVSAAGRWLAADPNASQESALSGIAPSLAPFFPGQTLFAETASWQQANSIILTASTKQTDPDLLEQAVETLQLDHTINFGLLPQAWVFRNPHPQPDVVVMEELAPPLSFGGQMMLLGEHVRRIDSEAQYTARWRKEAVEPRLRVQLRLVDEQGAVWQSLETELLNEVYFYPQYWQAEETPQITYHLDLPPGTPPGTYIMALSVIDESSGSHLATRGGGTIHRGDELFLSEPVPGADAAGLETSEIEQTEWFDGRLRLLGAATPPEQVTAGAVLPLELVWQKEGSLPSGALLAVSLGDTVIGTVPALSFEDTQWQIADTVRQKYAITVPADFPSGEYELSLGQDGELPAANLGAVRVAALDRLFALPESIDQPLEMYFAPAITLKGMNSPAIAAAPGAPIELTLVWQADGRTVEPVTAFVHLLDEAGAIVAQSDQWPGGLPSDTWSAGQVVIDDHILTIPDDAEPGQYRLVAGLYTASNGMRLPVTGSTAEIISGDRVLLPAEVAVGE